MLHPGNRHPEILFDLLRRLGTPGNLTTDAHLAALAIEHHAELHSTEAARSRIGQAPTTPPQQPGGRRLAQKTRSKERRGTPAVSGAFYGPQP